MSSATGRSPFVLPWRALGGTVAVCAAVAVAASVIPAALLTARGRSLVREAQRS